MSDPISIETEIINDLIAWLEDSDRQKIIWESTTDGGWVWIKQIEEFLEKLKLYRDDLMRRDADESASYLRGRRAGEQAAWNEMRNFVQMRTPT